jgi:hypothetical protein
MELTRRNVRSTKLSRRFNIHRSSKFKCYQQTLSPHSFSFKDPSGAPNERLAAVLIQNMNQLNDPAAHHLISYPCLPTGCTYFCATSYGIIQTSTNPRRQSRCVDLGAKGVKHILTPWHGVVNPVVLSLCRFRLHLPLSLHQPSQRCRRRREARRLC